MKKISFLIFILFFLNDVKCAVIDGGKTNGIAWFHNVLFPNAKPLEQNDKTFNFILEICKKSKFPLKNVFVSETNHLDICYYPFNQYFIFSKKLLEILTDEEFAFLVTYRLEREKFSFIVFGKIMATAIACEAFTLFALLQKEFKTIPIIDPAYKPGCTTFSSYWYFDDNKSFRCIRWFYVLIGLGCTAFYLIKVLIAHENKRIELAGGKEIYDRINKKILDENLKVWSFNKK